VSRTRTLDIATGAGRSTADLQSFLGPEQVERAASAANAWIKALRHVEVNDRPLRDRFTYRGDSLWWFTELYLHKQRVIQDLWEVALALDALADRERPTHVRVHEADAVLQQLLPQAAARFGFTCTLDRPAASSSDRLRTDLRSRAYTWSALASRLHPLRLLQAGRHAGWRSGRKDRQTGGTLVFVHTAFWRRTPGTADEGEEGYIGAVLRELRTRPEAQPLQLIGVGPRTNFRARRWWHALESQILDAQGLPLTPIEDLASWPTLAGSREMWRDRVAIERALLASAALRGCAQVEGYDIWPILAAELRGVARLQFPWSARAMDEAAAALDTFRPRLILTYAEAGGWGRALMLEARRRSIPSVGLQHGFIYRHWLNYLHAADEMTTSPGNRQDRGFPRPDLTLLYDDRAAQHLRTHGHFPDRAVRVTGSPALDALAASVSQVTDADRARVRAALGASPGDRLVIVVSKHTQIGPALPALVAATAALDNVRVVIKPHPAETAEAYADLAAGASRPLVAPPTLDLASLLATARLLVTVNSTVAIDAMTLGIPALVVLLPNNLSPFVEVGAMAGALVGRATSDGAVEELRRAVADLTLNEACHAALAGRAQAFAARHGIRGDGQSAARAAQAMVELLEEAGRLVGR
jgi:hypothetical protein